MGMDSATTMRQVQAEMVAQIPGVHHRLIVVVALIQMAMNGRIPMTIGPFVSSEWDMEDAWPSNPNQWCDTDGDSHTEIRITFKWIQTPV